MTLTLRRLGFLLASLCFLLGSGGCATAPVVDPGDGAIELRFVPPEGLAWEQTMVQRTTSRQELAGQPMDLEQVMEQVFSSRAVAVGPAGERVVETTLVALRANLDGMSETMEYDSSAPEDVTEGDPHLAMLGSLIGVKTTATIASDGSVLAMEGIEEILRRLEAALDEVDPSVRPFAESFFGKVGEEAFRATFAEMTGGLPPEPVGLGDQWVDTLRAGGFLPARLEVRSELVAFEEGAAVVAIDGTVSAAGDGAVIEMGPLTLRVELDGTVHGERRFDRRTGLLLEARLEQEALGSAALVGPLEISVALEVESTTEVTTRILDTR